MSSTKHDVFNIIKRYCIKNKINFTSNPDSINTLINIRGIEHIKIVLSSEKKHIVDVVYDPLNVKYTNGSCNKISLQHLIKIQRSDILTELLK
jgi:hypothetical protein